MTLLLWDVDGTLIRAGGLGREPFQAAVASAIGGAIDPRLHEQVQMSGKTDPQIARELLVLASVSEDDVERHLPEVLRLLESNLGSVEASITERGRVLPGVPEVLERCAALGPDVVVSTLLTGNLAGNALVKLRAFGLERWVDLRVGAYGSDHHDREELVPIALAKATSAYGRRFSASSTWVIGDTPRDLACARAGGARCVLVATGRFGRDELEACGADAVLDDLSDVDRVLQLFGLS
ncbi:MAG TPA: HAD family hydrolase [Acidimicrobiales bacterium]|nr:HAD family hydrolase [Acidimicrobiales bacterium]